MWKSVTWTLGRVVVYMLLLAVMFNRALVNGANITDCAAKRLTKYLSDGYGSPSLRPVVDYAKELVNVSFRVHISKIIDFDERQQQIRLEAWRKEEWVDQFLTWDPAEFDGLKEITYDHRLIWKPDIKLIENVHDDFVRVFDGDVIVTSEGKVTWFTPIMVTTLCHVHIRYFPFDSQTCTLTFQSWAYDTESLNLRHLEDEGVNHYGHINKTVLHKNGVWNLTTMTTPTNETPVVVRSNDAYYTQLVYALELRRFSSFYVSNLVLPSVLLAVLVCLVFAMPLESGERVNFAISNLLAAILFQQLVGGIMPPLGDDLSLLGIFFVFMLIMDCFVIAMTIVVLRMFHQRGDTAVPQCLLKVCFVDADDDDGGWKPADGARVSAQRKQNADNWKAAARMMDKYLCVIVAIVTMIVTSTIGLMFITRDDN